MIAGVGVLIGVAVLLGAIGLAYAAGALVLRGGARPYLCDRCKYDDARYCSRPERPNATECAEFKER